MEQNFDPNSQVNLPRTPDKFPTWVIALITIIITALIVGLATYLFIKNKKEVANNNVPTQSNNNANIAPNNTTNTALSVVNDLNTNLNQQGYEINTNSFESINGGTVHVWWAATDRLAVNITPVNGFSFDITKSAPDYSVENMTINSDIVKVINTINKQLGQRTISIYLW